ncbi:MAG: two-component regulator propeller domain-containing protein [Acidobacteriota bacterium]
MRLLRGVVFLLMATPLFALDPAKKPSQYCMDVWQVGRGLPQNHVIALLHGRKGYLWLSTFDGLARFDGVSYKAFGTGEMRTGPSNIVREIFQDENGVLWMGTQSDGLISYSDGLFRTYTVGEGLAGVQVLAIARDGQAGLWIGTDRGLNRLKNGRVDAPFGNVLTGTSVRSLCIDRHGGLWIGTDGNGLFHARVGAADIRRGPAMIASETIDAIREDREGMLWVGTSKGIVTIKQGGLGSPTRVPGLEHMWVTCVLQDRDGSLWVGSSSAGVARIAQGRVDRLTTRDGLPSDQVQSMAEDPEGSLWIGTIDGGLVRLKDEAFTAYTSRQGLSGDMTSCCFEDHAGAVWVGTTKGGLSRLDARGIEVFDTSDGLNDNLVTCVIDDDRGRIWVGSYGGLNQIFDGMVQSQGFLPGLHVFSTELDRDGALWAGTDGGLYRIREGDTTHYSTRDGLSDDGVSCLLVDGTGKLWVGTDGGLNYWTHDNVPSFGSEKSLSGSSVTCIFEDAERTVWVGTERGLHRCKDGRFSVYTSSDGLYDDNIVNILEDRKGNLWLGGKRGVFYVSKKELDDRAAGRIASVRCVAFNEEDGLKSRTCNGFSRLRPAADGGKLWFPTINGVACVDPDGLMTNTLPPPVVIEEVHADDRTIDPTTMTVHEHAIQAGTKRVEFRYTALSLRKPRSNLFKYRLDGYDRDWHDAGTARMATYTNLRPGRYAFRVKACNGDGVWNEKGDTFTFFLEPFFYQTWWFTVLAAAGFVALSYYGTVLLKHYVKILDFWKRKSIFGHFEILDVLGSGGMATVYRARDRLTKSRIVALKVLREEENHGEDLRKRFKQEAAIVDRLADPHIVKVFERGQVHNSPYIAMELLDGKDLGRFIADAGRVEIPTGLHITEQICSTLVRIHAEDVVHRDLKPENMMIVERDGDPHFVLLLDFGLAIARGQTRVTQTGNIVGSLPYLPPERVTQGRSCKAGDVYAVGVILYELLSGTSPFQGEDAVDVIQQILNASPPPPSSLRPEVPEDLNDLVMAMIDKRPEERLSAEEAREAVAELLRALRS